MQEVGGATRTKYGDWSFLMKVMLQTRGLWNAVRAGTDDVQEAR